MVAAAAHHSCCTAQLKQPHKPDNTRCLHRFHRSRATCAATLHSPAVGAWHPPPRHGAHIDFILLWTRYNEQLKISRQATDQLLHMVGRGQLPCSAPLLRDRVVELMQLEVEVAGLSARQAINLQPDVLAADARHMVAYAKKLCDLLPQAPPTPLFLATYTSTDLPSQLLALSHSELSLLSQALCGLELPPALFRHLAWTQLRASLQPSTSSSGLPPSVASAGDASLPPGPNNTARSSSSSSSNMQAGLGSACQQLEVGWSNLSGLLGPELAYAALSGHPQLLDSEPEELQRTLTWLSRRLGAEGLANTLAGLPADTLGRLLAAPDWQLTAVDATLQQQLEEWLGWGSREQRALLRRTPGLLLLDQQQLCSSWRWVQAAAKRVRWRSELEQPTLALVAAVLQAQPEFVMRLLFLLRWPAVLRVGLQQVLTMHTTTFLQRAPGYLAWYSRAGPAAAAMQQMLHSSDGMEELVQPLQAGWVPLEEGRHVGGNRDGGLVHLGVRALPLRHLL